MRKRRKHGIWNMMEMTRLNCRPKNASVWSLYFFLCCCGPEVLLPRVVVCAAYICKDSYSIASGAFSKSNPFNSRVNWKPVLSINCRVLKITVLRRKKEYACMHVPSKRKCGATSLVRCAASISCACTVDHDNAIPFLLPDNCTNSTIRPVSIVKFC